MDQKLVSVNILLWHSEKFIAECLNSVFAQTHQNLEFNFIDNGSSDNSLARVREIMSARPQYVVRYKSLKDNIGFAGGHNEAILMSQGEYILPLNPDVFLDKNFVESTLKAMESDKSIGAVQGKILQMSGSEKTNIIDTLGFAMFRSGRMIDMAQGEEDKGQYNQAKEIFCANGTAPLYRRAALDDVKLIGENACQEFFDKDFFAYAEEVDLGWRLRWRGWNCLYVPLAIAWHDRGTGKQQAEGFWGGWKVRRQQRKIGRPQTFWAWQKTWRNQKLVLIKNLPLVSFIKFAPAYLWREAKLTVYFILFEKAAFNTIYEAIKMVPLMLKKRRMIMARRSIDASEIEKWFE